MDEDFFLGTLVEQGLRTSITISVHGTLLEGDMISEREFFEGTAAIITSEENRSSATPKDTGP